MQAAARSNLKDVALELGGKSPLIVFADANLSQAAKSSLQSFTFSTWTSPSLKTKHLVCDVFQLTS